jgi:hypothetical protein
MRSAAALGIGHVCHHGALNLVAPRFVVCRVLKSRVSRPACSPVAASGQPGIPIAENPRVVGRRTPHHDAVNTIGVGIINELKYPEDKKKKEGEESK